MKLRKAFLGGVLAGLLVTILTGLARLFAITPLNLEMIFGSLFTSGLGRGTWLLGLGIYLVIGGITGLIYAWFFDYVSHRANPSLGLMYGMVHAFVAGLIFLVLPTIHPIIPETIEAPGFLGANYGALTIATFLIVHLIFGTVMGVVYGSKYETGADVVREIQDRQRKKAA